MSRQEFAMPGFTPFHIAVASGKGGTGKTLVATNLFQSLISNNVEAVLVDCDAEAPNALLSLKGHQKKSQKLPNRCH